MGKGKGGTGKGKGGKGKGKGGFSKRPFSIGGKSGDSFGKGGKGKGGKGKGGKGGKGIDEGSTPNQGAKLVPAGAKAFNAFEEKNNGRTKHEVLNRRVKGSQRNVARSRLESMEPTYLDRATVPARLIIYDQHLVITHIFKHSCMLLNFQGRGSRTAIQYPASGVPKSAQCQQGDY